LQSKSGGHAAFGGVTVNLVNLNNITIWPDQNMTGLGSGNRWFDLYTKLDVMSLFVVGGRVADVGVGGG
jgi:hypothetical protein